MERSFQAAMLLHDPEVVFVLGKYSSLIYTNMWHTYFISYACNTVAESMSN